DYHSDMTKKNYGKAVVSIIKNTGDEGTFMKFLPGFIFTSVMNYIINAEVKKKVDKEEVPLKPLISAMQYDLELVNQSGEIINKVNNITADILLVGGEKSIFFLKDILE